MKKEEQVLEISGAVSSGLKKGRYFMSKIEYLSQMKKEFSFLPYPGTLNITLSGDEMGKVQALKQKTGILIRGFKEGEKTFGDVVGFKAEIQGIKCAVILPKLSTHTDKIEVIGEKYLRDQLKLSDGQVVTVRIVVS